MRRKESVYAVIGGIAGAVLTLAVCSVMPIGAQNGDTTFGEITCTKLNVVDAAGETNVYLGTDEDGGSITVGGEAGSVRLEGGNIMVIGDKTGRVMVFGGAGAGDVWIGADEAGGSILVSGFSGMVGSVRIDIDDDGGNVDVKGKAGNVGIGSDERGGQIVVQKGNGRGDPRVLIGVDSRGEGRVITGDKNGL